MQRDYIKTASVSSEFRNRDYLHPISLPGLEIPGSLFLAPLAGFTDAAFRSICIDFGADFTFSEMVSAEGLRRGSEKTKALLRTAENETRFGIQIFAGNPHTAKEAAALCLCYSPSLIDINCGCPVPKVVKTGAGAALLRDPEKLHSVVKEVKEGAAGTGRTIPVSVKIRSGWDAGSINYLETAEAAAAGGADMITLHPRTRSQGYSGNAAWRHIEELKRNISVPIIGSGDLFTPEDIRQMFEQTGCDGVMIARGAVGNPFIFKKTKMYLASGTLPPQPEVSTRLETAWKHYLLLCRYKGETTASKEIKKQFCAYTKGIPHGGELRNRLVHAESKDEFQKILKEFKENY